MDDQLRYRLLTGAVYTLGCTGCDINVANDASISKSHLTVEVSLLPTRDTDQSLEAGAEDETYPAQIILTDTSEYGTEVFCSSLSSSSSKSRYTIAESDDSGLQNAATRELQLFCDSAKRMELKKNEQFFVPRDVAVWRKFSVAVGTNGTVLEFRWAPLCIFTLGIADQQWLDGWFSRCNASIVSDVSKANFFVTPCLTLAPVSIAALCCSSRIVTPAFFESLARRIDSDPSEFAPPLSSAWSAVTYNEDETKASRRPCESTAKGWNGETAAALEELVFKPLNSDKRHGLLAGVTFVVIQRALYEEVRVFVPCAQGCVLLDLSLEDADDHEGREAALSSFRSTHRTHVVLFSRGERLPFGNLVRLLRDRLGMFCLEYVDLVKCIVYMKPLPATSFHSSVVLDDPVKLRKDSLEEGEAQAAVKPHGDGKEREVAVSDKFSAKRMRTSRGLDGRHTDPIPLFDDLTGNAGHEISVAVAGDLRHHKRTRVEAGEGWIRREQSFATDCKDLVVAPTAALPPYPCFQSYASSSTSGAVVSNGVFEKQQLAACEDSVELMRVTVSSRTDEVLCMRSVDDVDIIPSEVRGVQNSNSFLSNFRDIVLPDTFQHNSGRGPLAKRRGNQNVTTHNKASTGLKSVNNACKSTDREKCGAEDTPGEPECETYDRSDNIFDVKFLL
ncbi:hypothetical protein ERJ75_000835500 [Trypanosoma vivax]|nr:hypothetical protein ERJ75_000835500 [Trypanosoma vivax]